MVRVVYNACYGGFSLSNDAMDRIIELGYEGLRPNAEYDPSYESFFASIKYWGDCDIPRHNPILVQVVEELGEKANGSCARLAIEEVDGPYRIEEYDGFETVKEPYDVHDWIIP
jgi:hypothetical protein